MHQENGELWYNINTSRVHLSDYQALPVLTGQALKALFYSNLSKDEELEQTKPSYMYS